MTDPHGEAVQSSTINCHQSSDDTGITSFFDEPLMTFEWSEQIEGLENVESYDSNFTDDLIPDCDKTTTPQGRVDLAMDDTDDDNLYMLDSDSDEPMLDDDVNDGMSDFTRSEAQREAAEFIRINQRSRVPSYRQGINHFPMSFCLVPLQKDTKTTTCAKDDQTDCFVIHYFNLMGLQGCKARTERLKDFTRRHLSDVVTIVDPPTNIKNLTFHNYKVWYGNENPLERTMINNAKPLRVAFLISDTIDPSTYSFDMYDDANHDKMATLNIRLLMGDLRIHLFYNPDQSLDIGSLLCNLKKDMTPFLAFCDSNLHHPMWAGNSTSPTTARARELAEGMENASAILLNKPGVATYRRKGYTGSTIDLAWASANIAKRVPPDGWGTFPVPGFQNCDHKVIQTVLNVAPCRAHHLRYRWKLKEDQQAKFRTFVQERLAALERSPLVSGRDIDAAFQRLMDILIEAVRKHVPLVNPLSQGLAIARSSRGDNVDDKRYMSTKSKAFKQWIAKETASRQKTDRLLRQSRRWGKGKLVETTPSVRMSVADGEIVITDPVEKSSAYMVHWYGEGKFNRVPEDGILQPFLQTTVSTLPPSLLHTCPPGTIPEGLLDDWMPSETFIRENIDFCLRRLKKKKSSGIDEVSNEALQLSAELLLEHLTWITSACLTLRYFPAYCKFSRLVALRKPNKDDYGSPNSWRPISLASCLGKVIEKVFGKVVTEYAMTHGIIPETQFGCRGKSTTDALKLLLNEVYIAWGRRQKITTMMLDMAGAFNSVDQVALLRAMGELGFPQWMADFVQSFLEARTVRLELPGQEPMIYQVKTGIPQGSSISPILFAIFAAKLISIKPNIPDGVAWLISAFVDDTGLTVRSSSFKKNCQVLEALHTVLVDIGSPMGIQFSPAKYEIMHFERVPSSQRCKKLPGIEGLTATHLDRKSMRILGVMVDYRLYWDDHIEKIISQMRSAMGYILRISNSVRGPSLLTSIRIFSTRCLSIALYGCGAWFVRADTDYDVPTKHVDKLELCYCQDLRRISGALKRTSALILLSELGLYHVIFYLTRARIVHNAKSLLTENERLLRERREYVAPWEGDVTRSSIETHPYARMSKTADELVRRAQRSLISGMPAGQTGPNRPGTSTMTAKQVKNLGRKVSIIVDEDIKCIMIHEFNEYRQQIRKHPELGPTVALDRKWSAYNREIYRNLPRMQSSILLQCRTGKIQLNAYLNTITKTKHDLFNDGFCTCGPVYQTVEHMFRDCPLLAEERDDAIHVDVGRPNLNDLLTKYGDLASRFAIKNFGIELFRYAQGYMVEVEGEKAPKKKRKKGSSTRRQRRAKVRAREEQMSCSPEPDTQP